MMRPIIIIVAAEPEKPKEKKVKLVKAHDGKMKDPNQCCCDFTNHCPIHGSRPGRATDEG